MKKLISFTFIVFVLFLNNVFSALPSGLEHLGSYYEDSQLKSNQFPPYSQSMPFDVLLAYIGMDTISHYGDYYTTKNFINRQTFTNDTLKKIMKHYFSVKNYDPIKFYKASNYNDLSHNLILSWVNADLDKQISILDNDSLGYFPLLSSDYVLHIKVTDTIAVIDTNSHGAGILVYEVYFDVIDNIKGKVLPNCKHDSLNENNNCKFFTYSPLWKRNFIGSQEKSLYQDNGKPWIEKDKEYIVFLSIITVRNSTKDKFYFVIRPISPESAVFRMFPIDENGNIYNPRNEFGIPNNSSLTVFKQNLYNRIKSILGN